MAHADYNCCAVCDSKLSYAGFSATAKEEICSRCVANLAEKGVIVHDVDELIEWIKNEDAEKVAKVLKDVGFRFCYYSNTVDEIVERKIGDMIEVDDDGRIVSAKRKRKK